MNLSCRISLYSMKLSLQIKMGQQLTMTPTVATGYTFAATFYRWICNRKIQEALESNPLLEVDDSLDSAESSESKGENDFDQNEEFSSDTEAKESDIDQDPNAEFASEDNWDDKNIPTDLSVDSSWEDVYTNTTLPSAAPAPDGGDFDFESRNSKSGTLQDHLNWQLNLTHMSDGDRLIAMAIIDAIDPNGLLTVTIESIHASLIRELDIDEEEVTAVLHLIQQFDPVGVGYRDFKRMPGDTAKAYRCRLALHGKQQAR